MAFAETAQLTARLSLQDQFTGPLKNANRALSGFDAKLSKTQGRAFKAGQQIGTGIQNGVKIGVAAIGTLTGLLVLSAKEGQEAAKTQAIYAKAIENSGKVSAEYVTQLNDQQDALLELAGADDEAIKAAQTQLILMGLTGEQILKLTPLALDLATATGKDLTEATKAVGKAALGSNTALQRMGIIVPKGADAIAELDKRFKGTTKAISGGFDVRLKVLNERLANLREQAGIKLLPVMTRLVDIVSSRLVPVFGKLLDSILPHAIAGLDKLAGFLSSGEASDGVKSILKTAGTIAPVIQRAAEVTGQVIKTAVDLFRSLPPEIQSLAIAGLAVNKLTGGLVTNIAGGLISAVIASFRGLMNVNAAVVNVNGPVAGLPGGAVAGGGVAGLVKGALVLALPLIAFSVVKAFKEGQDPELNAQSAGIVEQTQRMIAANGKDTKSLQSALGGVEDGIKQIGTNPLTEFLYGQQLADLKTAAGLLRTAITSSKGRDLDPASRASANGLRESLRDLDIASRTSADGLRRFTGSLQPAKKRTREQIKSIQQADREARGITASGPSTTIAPRLRFLAGGASGKKDVAVAEALALGFERGKSPAFKNTAALKEAIKGVSRDIKTLPPQFAGPLGATLDRLKAELARRTKTASDKATAAAVRSKAATEEVSAAQREGNRLSRILVNKDPTIHVNVKPGPVALTVDGRLLGAALLRFTQLVKLP